MPTLEDEIRRLMADETSRLHAAPDLLERVLRGHRGRRRRARVAAVVASVAASVVVVAAPVVHLTAAPTPGDRTAADERATTSAIPEPPAIDDVPPERTEPATLGDLGDGKEVRHVKVGYLPEGLRWSGWSLDDGDRYTASYNFDGDSDSTYRMQLFVHEDTALQEIADRIQMYRDEEEGEDVTVGDRSGYLVLANVGEDGMKGSPTLFLKMGDRQWAEIIFSPVYVKRFPGDKAVRAELWKVAEGLTSTL
ncbi:hypothetical protein FAF44_00375 [Nonomuraea sp. MG754425]|uniref:hypothetical protein n=1 Tax=Nonomuraea sp. MG754425 TaxID=2570319 RepID=UPI001F44C3E8|nr:hypothetical protein [Nonomuraea sp. MG754425]MCF6466871.1 hypothetical protein [Nonomuraea sp. MG754425]